MLKIEIKSYQEITQTSGSIHGRYYQINKSSCTTLFLVHQRYLSRALDNERFGSVGVFYGELEIKESRADEKGFMWDTNLYCFR